MSTTTKGKKPKKAYADPAGELYRALEQARKGGLSADHIAEVVAWFFIDSYEDGLNLLLEDASIAESSKRP